MKTFDYTLWPAREGFAPVNATAEEGEIIREHWHYLVALNDAGRIRFVGRTDTDPFLGICVFTARDQDEANAIAENDPAVKKGAFKFRCQPFTIFFPVQEDA